MSDDVRRVIDEFALCDDPYLSACQEIAHLLTVRDYWHRRADDLLVEVHRLRAEVEEKDRLLACFRTRFSELYEEFSEMAREATSE